MAEIDKIHNGANVFDLRDASAVHKTGNEEIEGVKTFKGAVKGGSVAASSFPIVGYAALAFPESGGFVDFGETGNVSPKNGWISVRKRTSEANKELLIQVYKGDTLIFENKNSPLGRNPKRRAPETSARLNVGP